MDSQVRTRKNWLIQWFFLCPRRHVLLLCAAAVTGAYFALRGNHALMSAVSEGFVQPCHRALGKLCGLVEFSVAEWLVVLFFLLILVYIIYTVIQLIRRHGRGMRLYRFVVTLGTAGLAVYAGFCLLWGVYYYGDSFSQKIGLEAEPVAAEDLAAVTMWFAELANEYAPKVERDERGVFAVDKDWILDRGETLYREIEAVFPALEGPELRPKPLVFSELLSRTNFTGFFFPFTGEANLNVHAPGCMLPSTVAHELAHQRGVAPEQEANFVAVAACLESGDEVFVYSGALLAYIYLGNALYSADYEAFEEVYYSLSEPVHLDLADRNAYWAAYEDTAVAAASESVYTGFLQSHGQTLGMRSYGACVDLLVAYYKETACSALEGTP